MNLHAEIIDLASEGFFYPAESRFASGKVEILPITAEHEELLANPNLARRGLLEAKFLDAVVVGGVNPLELLECDRQSILLNLRVANYGATSKVKTKCPECDHEFDADISLAFRAKPFDFQPYTRGINRLSYTFSRCKKTVQYRLANCAEAKIFETDGWLAFAKCITESITDVDDIEDFYNQQLSAVESSLFRRYYESHSPGYVNEVSITCPSCKAVKTNKMEISPTIFGIRPESRLTIHSEIFDLCYYSNGAFTQEGVYHMPTSQRAFYIKKLLDAKQAEAEAQKNATKGESPNSKVAKPPKVKM